MVKDEFLELKAGGLNRVCKRNVIESCLSASREHWTRSKITIIEHFFLTDLMLFVVNGTVGHIVPLWSLNVPAGIGCSFFFSTNLELT